MKRCLFLIAIVFAIFSCEEKAPEADPTPTFSPTNNNTQQVQDTLGFKTDSSGKKDTSNLK